MYLGAEPLQQYMVELDRPADAQPHEVGRVQVLRISWDTQNQRWFYLLPADVHEKIAPDDPLHWTGSTQNWNSACAYCHSTDLQKNFDSESLAFRTTFSEIDVSCEACHGPGSLHVELAQQTGLFWDRNHGYGLAKLKSEDHKVQIETCAACHSRRQMIADGFRPGCNFDDYFSLQPLVEPVYHADGQIRDEDYVYGSFLQSKMYHQGIRCTDCHDPHSARVKHTGNLLCTSCHQHPSGKYDSPNHHHHEPGSPGARCVACHMPETTYMMIDPRRDHSLRVPRPDLSVQHGIPNACTQCHLDPEKLPASEDRKPLRQYLDWIIAAERGDQQVKAELERVNQEMLAAVKKWYPPGHSSEIPNRFYEMLVRAQPDSEVGLKTLFELAQESLAPGIMRASVWHRMANQSDLESYSLALEALSDPDPQVIVSAALRMETELFRILERAETTARPLEQAKLSQSVSQLAGLLDHSRRTVRLEATRVLASIPPSLRQQMLLPAQENLFSRCMKEYRESLLVNPERALSHAALGTLAHQAGKLEQAIKHFRTALAVEPGQPGVRPTLANLLLERLEMERDSLPTAETKMLLEEVKQLRTSEHALLAAQVRQGGELPGLHELHYRYAMSAYMQNELAETEKILAQSPPAAAREFEILVRAGDILQSC